MRALFDVRAVNPVSHKKLEYQAVIQEAVPSLTLSLPRVVNVKFPLKPHTVYEELGIP